MMALLASLLLTQLTAKKTGWWEVSVRYPRFTAPGAVARAANAEAAKRERMAFGPFLAEAKKELPELKRNVSAGNYELQIVPHRITDRAGLASGYVDRYDYRAGAHGFTSFDAINVALIGGRVRAFGLRDLFRPSQNAVTQASRAIIEVLRATKGEEVPSDVAGGQWTRLKKDQVDRFVVGPKGILFLFDNYDLGPYVEGPRLVLVPFAKLPGLDRNGVLKPVVKPL